MKLSNDDTKDIELRLCINNNKLLNCFEFTNIEKIKELIKACSVNNNINYDKFELMLNYYSSFIAADSNNNKKIDDGEFAEFKFIVWLINENNEPTSNDIKNFKSNFKNANEVSLNDYID